MNLILYVLLGLVALAAAVLSFDAILALAVVCGFAPVLAWLLPLTVDVGAAAGTLVWLGRPAGPARSFGRALALLLLGLSVAGNALSHGLAAYGLVPAWWVVVLVSAVPPAVLGATVHLAVLAGRAQDDTVGAERAVEALDDEPEGDGYPVDLPDPARWWADSPPAGDQVGDEWELAPVDRAAELIAAGAGRRTLARELGISEHQARQMLDQHRAGVAA